jgi:hypothetical protein
MINSIYVNDSIISGQHEISEAFHKYFKKLFGGCSKLMQADFSELYTRDAPDDLRDLEQNFTIEELKVAVFDLVGDKAPGPDGFPMLFYQRFWDILKDDLFSIVMLFNNGDITFDSFDYSYIALIPKKSNSLAFGDYRPISLTNCLHKIFSKMLANRLSALLHKLVHHSQSAYSKGRVSLDNFVMVHQILHHSKQRRQENFSLKLDF